MSVRSGWSKLWSMPRRLLALSLLLLAPLACSDDGGGESASGIVTTFGTESASASASGPSTSATDSDPSASDSQTSASSDSDSATDSDSGGSGDSFCVHNCASDADCFIDGIDSGFVCQDNLCTSSSASCTGQEECVALFSGRSNGSPCTPGGGECDAAMQVCLDIEGAGRCAIAPSDFIDCVGIGMEEIQTTDIDGNPVIVCGRPNADCHPDGYCWLPCQTDADCASESYPSCNPGTGFCECTSDAGCAALGLPQASVCNAGVCGCSSDDDCLAGGAGDLCTSSGSCGCSDDAACAAFSNPYDGGMYVCEEF